MHSELGQSGTRSDKEVGFLCRVNLDKLGQVGTKWDKDVGSLCTVSWDKVGKSETKKWDLRAQ